MGIVLSFIVAITEAIKNIFVKKSALKFSTVMTAWSWQATSLIIMVPVLLVVDAPELNSAFWISSSVKIDINSFLSLSFRDQQTNLHAVTAVIFSIFYPTYVIMVGFAFSTHELDN